MAECLASKQPLGEYRSDSLAAEEILTLANWCLLHFATGGAGQECCMSRLSTWLLIPPVSSRLSERYRHYRRHGASVLAPRSAVSG
jgi:hypothetical protein